MVLPVYHALQGHPESGKQWMHLIDNILLKKMGFHTTTHDRCIYRRVLKDGSVQLLLRQVDDFLLACNSKKVAEQIFQDIKNAIRFPSEVRDGIVPFEFLGVVKDYNGVDIKQTKDYIEMLCYNYLRRLLKSHGWDTDSSKMLPSEVVLKPESIVSSDNVDASNKCNRESVDDVDDFREENNFSQSCASSRDFANFDKNSSDASLLVSSAQPPHSLRAVHESSNDLLSPPVILTSKLIPTTPIDSDTKINTNSDLSDKNLHHKMEQQASMKSSKPLAPLPPDCIEKIFQKKVRPKEQ